MNSVERLLEKMNLERRSLQRETPEKLSYIQFEPEGGGIVVNASEQGLAFHAANELRQPGPIRLSISPNPTQRLELAAEIVWMDDGKKFGGLRFTEVTAEAKKGIRQWLAETAESVTPDTNPAGASYAPKDEIDPGPAAWKSIPNRPRMVTRLGDARRPLATHAPLSAPRFLNVPPTAHLSEPFSQRSQTPSSLAPLVRGLALGILFFAVVFAAFLFLGNVRQGVGSSLIRVGEKLKSDTDTPVETSSSPPVQVSSPGSVNPPLVSPTPESPPTEIPDETRPASSIQSTAETGNSTDTRQDRVPVSRLHFVDTHSRSDRSVLAQQLWAAVEAGDSSSEAALAQLYLMGDGVPRSCEQARVLLRAASKKGNIEAGRQLRKLSNSACR
jgi:hypothetical protein